MITFSLQSGSNGNCIYVEAGDVRLLFDAGISGRLAVERAAVHGRNLRDCHALIISHDHWDHSRSAGVFQRKFGLPIYMTEPTYRAVQWQLGQVGDVRRFKAGKPIVFGGVTVHTIPTPHDGVDSACFIVEHDGSRLGIFTDLGHPFEILKQAMSEVHAAYLESNYDPEMLWNGPYPEELKKRIAGDGGHLSNPEAADLVHRLATSRLRWLAAAHLSEHNNTPELAFETHRKRVGRSLPLHLAPRYEASGVFEL